DADGDARAIRQLADGREEGLVERRRRAPRGAACRELPLETPALLTRIVELREAVRELEPCVERLEARRDGRRARPQARERGLARREVVHEGHGARVEAR